MATRTEERLNAALDEAKATILAQQAQIEELTAGPWMHGTIIELREESVMLAALGGVGEVPASPAQLKTLKPGDVARLAPGGAIGEIVPGLGVGSLHAIVEVRPKDAKGIQRVQLGDMSGKRLVFAGAWTDKLEPGDFVLLDNTGHVVMAKGNPTKSLFQFEGETGIDWDDIIGLDSAKRTLRDAIVGPREHAAVYARWGRKPMKGIALDGPPGCGKTLLGKAAATEMRRVWGMTAGVATGYIYVKGPEILNKFVGESEARVRGLFEQARKHRAKHGYPAIIFIDEADAILRKRGTGRTSDMESTIVPMFLAEMDGLEEAAALVLLATNRLDVLDPAILREGRIDRKLNVGRPDEAVSQLMFAYYMRNLPIGMDAGIERLALGAATLLFDGARWPLGKHTLTHEVSGAMIAGIVERAADLAMSREIDGEGDPRLCGLLWRDLDAAITQVWQEHAGVSASDARRVWREEVVDAEVE